jgi:hypothetical protein
MKEHLHRFFVRNDAEYETWVQQYQAKTPAGKFFYLFMHLLPGLLAYVLIHIPSVHAAALRLTGLSDPIFQGTCLVGVVFVWHAVVPLIVLRWADGLSFQESVSFLGLRKFDSKGLFLVMPVVFVAFTLISLPYMKYVFPALTNWISAIPLLNPPEYSIFPRP